MSATGLVIGGTLPARCGRSPGSEGPNPAATAEWERRAPMAVGCALVLSRPISRSRAFRDAAILAWTIASVWVLFIDWPNMVRLAGNDGLVYWAVDPADPYRDATVGGEGAYLYSPAFTLLMTPLRALPREGFLIVWTGLIILTALWLGRRWPLALLPLGLPVLQDIAIGNIHLLMTAAIVLSFRWPATWA